LITHVWVELVVTNVYLNIHLINFIRLDLQNLQIVLFSFLVFIDFLKLSFKYHVFQFIIYQLDRSAHYRFKLGIVIYY
jgi:hypothetical protein